MNHRICETCEYKIPISFRENQCSCGLGFNSYSTRGTICLSWEPYEGNYLSELFYQREIEAKFVF